MKAGILAVALIIGGAVFGQAPAKKERKTAEERATAMTEKMTTKLELTEDQKAQIQDINLGIAQKNDAIRSNTSLSREEKMKQMQENHQARDTMYQKVLTDEQYAKYQAWEKEKMEKMKAKQAERKASGGKGKGAKPAPSAPSEEEDEQL